MLGLKILVGTMTVLIIAGVGVIIGGLAMKAKDMKPSFQPAEVTVPKGGKLVDTQIQGDRVVVRVAQPDGQETLHIFDLGSGRPLGTIAVKNAQ